jgi:hypothetical protein
LGRNRLDKGGLLGALLERSDQIAPVWRILLARDALPERWRQRRRVQAFEGRADLDPLAIGHYNLEAILAGDKRRENRSEGSHARPESACTGSDWRDDLGHALVAEQLRYRYRDFVEAAAAQLQKVWHRIVGDDSIDRRIQIISQRQEIDLDDL